METNTNAQPWQSHRYIRFGPFQIDQQRGQLSRSGTRLKLRGKVYQVLVTLITKHQQVVTREELKQALWSSDTHVNFNRNVNTTVNELRKILEDSAEQPAYIETIPRQGYYFLVKPEYSVQPFRDNLFVPQAETEVRALALETKNSGSRSHRWLTFALILAGVLFGFGITTFWLTHIGPASHR